MSDRSLLEHLALSQTVDAPVASMDKAPQFVHEALDLTQPSIRLLHILPGQGKDLVQCTLETVRRNDWPSYVCLSYTWGEPQPLHTILVNGRPLGVRSNLYNFLRLARKLNIKQRLWIDAVCIDQENVLERNHQVCSRTRR
jgi:hypothetical protein